MIMGHEHIPDNCYWMNGFSESMMRLSRVNYDEKSYQVPGFYLTPVPHLINTYHWDERTIVQALNSAMVVDISPHLGNFLPAEVRLRAQLPEGDDGAIIVARLDIPKSGIYDGNSCWAMFQAYVVPSEAIQVVPQRQYSPAQLK